MPRPKEEKLDFLRNVGGCVMTYLRAGNDKTALEESLMTLKEYINEEIKRLGFDTSLPSLPESSPKSAPKSKGK